MGAWIFRRTGAPNKTHRDRRVFWRLEGQADGKKITNKKTEKAAQEPCERMTKKKKKKTYPPD